MADKFKTWLRVLNLAKILFEDQGYHTKFLEEIEEKLKEMDGKMWQLPLPFPKPKKRRVKNGS